MREATAIISPSIFDEPLGNTNIEALAMGTPLIASDAGAIHEIVDHGKSGLIYRRANPEELARNMGYVLSSPQILQSLAKGGIERVEERFLQTLIIRQVEGELQKIVDRSVKTQGLKVGRAGLLMLLLGIFSSNAYLCVGALDIL
jgi:glycosyltransferase involved in cell wall biosynthesis